MVKTETTKAVQDAAYALASALQDAAREMCKSGDTHAVHWLVSEERKAAMLGHRINQRFGANN
jgi:hypothetical protein